MKTDKGLKRNGRPRKVPPRPQEANPAWLAATAAVRCQPGNANRRTCAKCKRLAVRASTLCMWHGGWRALPKTRLEDNRKQKAYRYAQWGLNAAQRARAEAQTPANPADAKEALGGCNSRGSGV